MQYGFFEYAGKKKVLREKFSQFLLKIKHKKYRIELYMRGGTPLLYLFFYFFKTQKNRLKNFFQSSEMRGVNCNAVALVTQI